MAQFNTLREGQRVHYIPFKGAPLEKYQNGIIKEIPDFTDEEVRVVFHCAEDWGNYKNYTSQLTPVSRLKLGWSFSESELNLEI